VCRQSEEVDGLFIFFRNTILRLDSMEFKPFCSLGHDSILLLESCPERDGLLGDELLAVGAVAT
jgi:hypothetical protein